MSEYKYPDSNEQRPHLEKAAKMMAEGRGDDRPEREQPPVTNPRPPIDQPGPPYTPHDEVHLIKLLIVNLMEFSPEARERVLTYVRSYFA